LKKENEPAMLLEKPNQLLSEGEEKNRNLETNALSRHNLKR